MYWTFNYDYQQLYTGCTNYDYNKYVCINKWAIPSAVTFHVSEMIQLKYSENLLFKIVSINTVEMLPLLSPNNV